MRHFKKRFAVLLLLCGLFFFQTSHIHADFGDYSGNDDFGGSDSGWSSFDYDDDDSSGGFWFFSSDDDDDDYSSSSGSFSSSDAMSWTETIIVLAVILFLTYFFYQRLSNRGTPMQQRPTVTSKPEMRGQPIHTYLNVDPNFDQAAFSEKLGNLYVQMQHAWTDKNIEPVRPYFSDMLFAQMDRQLQQKNQLHQTNYVQRIAVLEAKPETWYQEGGLDHIVATLKTRIVDFTLDDETQELISGSKTKEKFMTYQWTLSRKSGVETTKQEGMQTINCPNCGAPLSINASAKCPYCGSTITLEQEDWVIEKIQAISQQSR